MLFTFILALLLASVSNCESDCFWDNVSGMSVREIFLEIFSTPFGHSLKADPPPDLYRRVKAAGGSFLEYFADAFSTRMSSCDSSCFWYRVSGISVREVFWEIFSTPFGHSMKADPPPDLSGRVKGAGVSFLEYFADAFSTKVSSCDSGCFWDRVSGMSVREVFWEIISTPFGRSRKADPPPDLYGRVKAAGVSFLEYFADALSSRVSSCDSGSFWDIISGMSFREIFWEIFSTPFGHSLKADPPPDLYGRVKAAGVSFGDAVLSWLRCYSWILDPETNKMIGEELFRAIFLTPFGLELNPHGRIKQPDDFSFWQYWDNIQLRPVLQPLLLAAFSVLLNAYCLGAGCLPDVVKALINATTANYKSAIYDLANACLNFAPFGATHMPARSTKKLFNATVKGVADELIITTFIITFQEFNKTLISAHLFEIICIWMRVLLNKRDYLK